MNNFGQDFVKPILVLTVICLFISAALAFTNQKTAPIIEEAERIKAEQARKEVLQDADSFTLVEITGAPSTVSEIYKAENGAGYVVVLTTKGYGGDIKNWEGSVKTPRTNMLPRPELSRPISASPQPS